MLKRRLIPILYIKNGLIVRSENFSYHQNLGNVVSEAKRYSDWNVDELIYIDITRDGEYDLRRDDLKVQSNSSIISLLHQISKVCFMPLTFGGRIRNIEDIRTRIAHGADKISINTLLRTDPDVIKKSAELFGRQCIVASIDYKIINGKPIVFVANGTESTGQTVISWIKHAEKYCVGEIFLNAIDRDGMANGYDVSTINDAVSCTSLPVIAAGGAGTVEDFVELAEETNVSAIAAGNLFHFTENSYPHAKKYLLKCKVAIRP